MCIKRGQKKEAYNDEVTEYIEATWFIWLAPNVNFVKSTGETKKDNEVIETSTEELIHYSIP